MSTVVTGSNYQEASLERDPRWKLVKRIITTAGFEKSARLSSFLLYVVRETLAGNSEKLTEQLIGERIFERPIGYDPRDDNIVRVHATRLRRRLESYFQEEGSQETLKITLPRGGYVPVFERIDEPARELIPIAGEEIVVEETFSSAVTSGAHTWRWWGALLGCVALGLLLGIVTVFLAGPSGDLQPGAADQGPAHKLWSQLFDSNRETLIVPADSSLVVLRVFTGHVVNVSEYANGQYLADIQCDKPCDRSLLKTLAAHRYTSTADLELAVAVTHMKEAIPNQTKIRYARDLQLGDLKQSNLVLLGTPEANPWTGLFLSRTNFFFQDDRMKGPLEVENRNPKPGEPSHYPYDLSDAAHGYATVAFLPNLSGGGNVLIVQGFSLADTEAAADLVVNRKNFETLLRPIVGHQSNLSHFELLLKTFDVNGVGSPPSLLAYRLYP